MSTLTKNERGFKVSKPIIGAYKERITVFESSIAFVPHIWIRIEGHSDINRAMMNPSYDYDTDQMAHLTLRQAESLIKNLRLVIDNHYQKAKGKL